MLGLAMVIFIVGGLAAPPIIDQIPCLAAQNTAIKMGLCFVFAVTLAFVIPFTLEVIIWFSRKRTSQQLEEKDDLTDPLDKREE